MGFYIPWLTSSQVPFAPWKCWQLFPTEKFLRLLSERLLSGGLTANSFRAQPHRQRESYPLSVSIHFILSTRLPPRARHEGGFTWNDRWVPSSSLDPTGEPQPAKNLSLTLLCEKRLNHVIFFPLYEAPWHVKFVSEKTKKKEKGAVRTQSNKEELGAMNAE